MLVAKNTLFGLLVTWFTGCSAVSPGQRPFWASASISVPGAPASSLLTDSQLEVLKPGVEICAPDWVAVALLWTFQPVVAPRSEMSLAPVSDGEAAGSAGAAALAAPAGRAAWARAACALVAAASDATASAAAVQNTELRCRASRIPGDLSATRHDRLPPLSDAGRR